MARASKTAGRKVKAKIRKASSAKGRKAAKTRRDEAFKRRKDQNVRGLNTAATLSASSAVGGCAGADMVAQAALLMLFVLGGNTLRRPLVNAIDLFPSMSKSRKQPMMCW